MNSKPRMTLHRKTTNSPASARKNVTVPSTEETITGKQALSTPGLLISLAVPLEDMGVGLFHPD
jgi:hypothetical protein